MWQLPSSTLSALISISDYHEYMQEHVFVRITSQSSSVCLHFTFSVELIYHSLHWRKVMCVVFFFDALYRLRNPWGKVIWDFGLKIDLKLFWLDFLEMLCKLCKRIPCVLDSMCKCNIVHWKQWSATMGPHRGQSSLCSSSPTSPRTSSITQSPANCRRESSLIGEKANVNIHS